MKRINPTTAKKYSKPGRKNIQNARRAAIQNTIITAHPKQLKINFINAFIQFIFIFLKTLNP